MFYKFGKSTGSCWTDSGKNCKIQVNCLSQEKTYMWSTWTSTSGFEVVLVIFFTLILLYYLYSILLLLYIIILLFWSQTTISQYHTSKNIVLDQLPTHNSYMWCTTPIHNTHDVSLIQWHNDLNCLLWVNWHIHLVIPVILTFFGQLPPLLWFSYLL